VTLATPLGAPLPYGTRSPGHLSTHQPRSSKHRRALFSPLRSLGLPRATHVFRRGSVIRHEPAAAFRQGGPHFEPAHLSADSARISNSPGLSAQGSSRTRRAFRHGGSGPQRHRHASRRRGPLQSRAVPLGLRWTPLPDAPGTPKRSRVEVRSITSLDGQDLGSVTLWTTTGATGRPAEAAPRHPLLLPRLWAGQPRQAVDGTQAYLGHGSRAGGQRFTRPAARHCRSSGLPVPSSYRPAPDRAP